MDPTLMIGPIRSFSDRYADTIAPRRFIALVLTLFACFGLILSVVGLYSLMAASVAQRLPEFAIRAAMGATHGRVHAIVLREAMLVVGVGIYFGVPAVWAGTQLLRAQLFEVQSLDPVTWLGSVALLGSRQWPRPGYPRVAPRAAILDQRCGQAELAAHLRHYRGA